MLGIGLYHTAFSRCRCFCCDFSVFVGLDALIERYVDALVRELAAVPPDVAAGSLFFGGRTPSMLSVEQMGRLVGAVRRHLCLRPGAEVTLEANPCEL
jgi:oxygen-independent coproporphyrinogen-3 oxidase